MADRLNISADALAGSLPAQTTTNPQPVATPSPMANLVGGSAPIFDSEARGAQNMGVAHTDMLEHIKSSDYMLEQIKSGEYKLVEDGTPPPKPHLFF